MNVRRTFLTWAILVGCTLGNRAGAQFYTREQTFDEWPGAPHTAWVTNTLPSGWAILQARVWNSFGRAPQPTLPYMCWLNDDTSVPTTPLPPAWVQSPHLTNGVGVVQFWYLMFLAESKSFQVQYSTNGTTWVTYETVTDSNREVWKQYQKSLDVYEPCWVRILGGENLTKSVHLGIDNLYITDPPAGVRFANVRTVPSPALSETEFDIECDIIPMASASNVAGQVFYRVGTAGAYTRIDMENPSGNHFITSLSIPGEPLGTTVQYYIQATFRGFHPLGDAWITPKYYPAGAPATPVTFVVYRSRNQFSSFTNMTVTGSYSGNLYPSADYQWEGVATLGSSVSNPTFKFAAKNTAGATTQWGDTLQTYLDLPVFGAADVGSGTSIRVNGTQSGSFVFDFNETNRNYYVRKCYYQNFQGWTDADAAYGTYTFDGWQLVSGRTTATGETAKAFLTTGRSGLLSDQGTEQYLRSPYLANGVGQVSFRYRNWDDTGFDPTEFSVQASRNGTTGWVTAGGVSNVVVADYLHYSVLLRDRYFRYVRILNSTNAGRRAPLALDEVAISEPGASLVFTNIVTVPANPTIFDQPDIEADLIPKDRATLTSATLWYRVGTDGPYDSIPMASVGGTRYRTTEKIPRSDVGTMQYYFDYTFTEPATTGPIALSYPPDAPLAYTVTGAPRITGQNFDTWPGAPMLAFGSASSPDGWSISQGRVRDSFGRPVQPTLPYMCWLNDDTASAWVQSPLLTNGVGTLTFWYVMFQPSPAKSFHVQYSLDGSNWITFQTVTDSNRYAGKLYTGNMELYAPCYIRILGVDTVGGTVHLGVDDIRVETGYPACDVRVSNVMVHPGYPSRNEPAEITCDIESLNPDFPALNIAPKVFYRAQGTAWGPYMNMAPLVRHSIHYRTPVGIPVFPPNTVVEYYVRCDYKGYRSSQTAPRYFPTENWTTQPLSYTVRYFDSLYRDVRLSVTNAAVSMSQDGNGQWQAIIDFASPTVNPTFHVSGENPYSGTGYMDQTNAWGDSAQDRDTLPLASTLQPGGGAVTLNQTVSGQVVFTFDEQTLSYTLRRCRYQDFNNWEADPTHFEVTPGARITTLENEFAGWPLTPTTISIKEDFQDRSDAPNPDYYWDPYLTFHLWYVRDALLFAETPVGTTTNKAVRLMDYANHGSAWPYRSVVEAVDGVQNVSFRYRSTMQDDYSSWYQQGLQWKNYTVQAKIKALSVSPETPFISILGGYQSSDNYYEFRLTRENTTQIRTSIWRRQGGTFTQLYNSPNPISGQLTSDSTVRLLVSLNNGGTVYVEGRIAGTIQASAYDAAPSYLRNPGTVGFAAWDAEMAADDVGVTATLYQGFGNWNGAGPVNGWTFTGGTANGDFGNIPPGAYLTTPELSDLGNAARKYVFQYRAGAAGNASCDILASQDGSTFAVVDQIPTIGNTTYLTYTKPFDLTGYHYLRFANSGAVDLQIDDLTITAADNGLHSTAFSAVGDWNTAGGQWAVGGGTFNRRVPVIGYAVQSAVTNGSSAFGPLPSAWVTKASLQSASLTWSSQTVTFEDWRSMFLRVLHTSNDASMCLDDLQFRSWRGTNYNDNGWLATEGWVINSPEGGDKMALELRRSRANPNLVQGLRSPWMTNGVGRMSVRYYVYQGPAVVDFQRSYPEVVGTNEFFTLQAFTNTTPGWYTNTVNIRTNEPMYVRFRLVSENNNAHLYVANTSVTDWPPTSLDSWFAFNALITEVQNTREFEGAPDRKTCFLNHNPDANTIVRLDEDMPYIESAFLSNGIGQVGFFVKNWMTQGAPPPATVYLKASPTQESDPGKWTEIARFADIQNTTEYLYYTTNFFLPDFRYLRVYCQTNTSVNARVCLDNVLIADPLGASLAIKDLALIPDIPLVGDRVRVQATVGDFVLSPQNIHVQLGYYVGTNGWGRWPSTNWVTMVKVNDDGRNQLWEVPRGSGVPPLPVDSVVQYRVAATFTGLFSENSSPTEYSRFSNPSWYEPADLNERYGNVTNVTPYYFVFSCLPGAVWINEFSYYAFGFFQSPDTEFVEICGPAGTDVRNWSMKLIDMSGVEPYPSYASYMLTIDSFAAETNNYGFWVVGDLGLSGVDKVFDHPTGGSSVHLRTPGGMRLIRSMGAYEHSVSYGDPALTNGFEYSATKLGGFTSDGPVRLIGSGTNGPSFAWAYAPGTSPTIGLINENQQLVEQQQNVVPDLAEVIITDFQLTGAAVWMTATGTNGWAPQPEYSTNLKAASPWTPIYNFGNTYSSGVWSIWFDQVDGNPVFYRVKATPGE